MNIEELKEFVDHVSELEKDKAYWKQKYYEATEQLRIANEKIAECNRIMKILASNGKKKEDDDRFREICFY